MRIGIKAGYLGRKERVQGLSAFTLFELLAVVAISGILLTLLVPTIVRARGQSGKARCESNLQQLGMGLNRYVADHHAYPLFNAWIQSVGREGLGATEPVDFTKGFWVCPSARWDSDKLPQGWVSASYGYNAYGLTDPKGRNLPTLGLGGEEWKDSDVPPTDESEVVKPAEMMALGDSLIGGISFTRENLESANYYGNASTRHLGSANVVFCDGHVESATLLSLDEATDAAALAKWNRDHQPHQERLGR